MNRKHVFIFIILESAFGFTQNIGFPMFNSDLLKSISHGISETIAINNIADMRQSNYLDLFLIQHSSTKTRTEIQKRIQTLLINIAEQNRCLSLANLKSSQDFEAELSELIMDTRLFPQQEESESSIWPVISPKQKRLWKMPSMSMIPGTQDSSPNSQPLVSSSSEEAVSADMDAEELQRRRRAIELDITKQLQMTRENKMRVCTEPAKSVRPGKGLSKLDIPSLEWEINRKDSKSLSLKVARVYAASKASDGWRFPTIWEIYTLYQQKSLLGEDLDDAEYWSITQIQEIPAVWAVSFLNGTLVFGCADIKTLKKIRLVRSI